jgi:DDE superfamily endonuclease
LPEDWCDDPVRRRKAKIPEPVSFQTKPELGVELIEHASTFQIDRAPVLGDAAYGDNTRLRSALHAQGIDYVLSIKAETTNLPGGHRLCRPERALGSKGPAPSALRAEEEAISAEQFARSLNPEDFHTVTFRGKGKTRVRSRFAFCRVTAAHPVTRNNQVPREEWLIIEWPEGRDTPNDYWTITRDAPTSAGITTPRSSPPRTDSSHWSAKTQKPSGGPHTSPSGRPARTHLRLLDRTLPHLPATNKPRQPPATASTTRRIMQMNNSNKVLLVPNFWRRQFSLQACQCIGQRLATELAELLRRHLEWINLQGLQVVATINDHREVHQCPNEAHAGIRLG